MLYYVIFLPSIVTVVRFEPTTFSSCAQCTISQKCFISKFTSLFDEQLPGKGLFRGSWLPNTVLPRTEDDDSAKIFEGGNIRIKPVEPMRRWNLKFKGEVEKCSDSKMEVNKSELSSRMGGQKSVTWTLIVYLSPDINLLGSESMIRLRRKLSV